LPLLKFQPSYYYDSYEALIAVPLCKMWARRFYINKLSSVLLGTRTNVRNPILTLSDAQPHVLKGLVTSYTPQEFKHLISIRKLLFRVPAGIPAISQKNSR